jgi:hypothetical protein
MLSKDGVGHTLKPLQQTFIIAKMPFIGTAKCPLYMPIYQRVMQK